jgi:UDP-glucose 4-epimerase
VTRLAEQPEAVGQVFNIGNTEEITISGLAERVIALTGSASTIQYVAYDEAYAPGFEDMQRRVPNLEKITRLTGYKPRHSLDDILQRVIAYEKDRLDDMPR